MPHPNAPPPPTFAELLADDEVDTWTLHCASGCPYNAEITTLRLIELFGESATMLDLRRMKCSGCGKFGATASRNAKYEGWRSRTRSE